MNDYKRLGAFQILHYSNSLGPKLKATCNVPKS